MRLSRGTISIIFITGSRSSPFVTCTQKQKAEKQSLKLLFYKKLSWKGILNSILDGLLQNATGTRKWSEPNSPGRKFKWHHQIMFNYSPLKQTEKPKFKRAAFEMRLNTYCSIRFGVPMTLINWLRYSLMFQKLRTPKKLWSKCSDKTMGYI